MLPGGKDAEGAGCYNGLRTEKLNVKLGLANTHYTGWKPISAINS